MASHRRKTVDPSDKEFPGIRLPGVGGLNPRAYENVNAGFPRGVGIVWQSNGVTLREQRMLEFMGQITDKPGWEKKVFDEEIVAKWRAESDVSPAHLNGDVYLSQQMFDFCISELRAKAKTFENTGRVVVLDAEIHVVKSDTAVSEELRQALCNGVKVLEDIPERLKDWHPGSDEQVLDLVHPSLFPLVYGLTRATPLERVPLDTCISLTGKGEAVSSIKSGPDTPSDYYRSPLVWGSYQWLPSEVELTKDGAKITSYINNLHPRKHKDLYGILEKILDATMPLWEDCLSGTFEHRRIRIESSGDDDYEYPEGLKYPIPGREGEFAFADPKEGTGDPEDDEDWRYDDDFADWCAEHRQLTQREPMEYLEHAGYVLAGNTVHPDDPSKKISPNLHQYPDGLQVIFKLANIHLTPEKPSYPGGSWHIEGAHNEMICASAIYYYDQDNITDSHLAFRQPIDSEEMCMIPGQSEYSSLEQYLGIEQEGPAIQDLGKVLTSQGRILAFPNCIHHQVQPFKLVDATRPGHRKILAMFLVDPNLPILSTAYVPPQRRDWWAEEVLQSQVLARLPNELLEQTVGMIDFPIGMEAAHEIREKLMDERRGIGESLMDYLTTEARRFHRSAFWLSLT